MRYIEWIKEKLKTFDMVILFLGEQDTEDNLVRDFCQSEALQDVSKRVMVFSAIDISDIKNSNIEYYRMNLEEQKAIKELYMMYEFSDHIRVLSGDSQYGGLLNYVKSGIMTQEEVFRAILM